MAKKVLVLIMCITAGILSADNTPRKNYPGVSVLKQEMANHREMLQCLEDMQARAGSGKQKDKEALATLINFMNSAIISLEYLDTTWEYASTRQGETRVERNSANLPCVCRGDGMCGACGGDGYVWVPFPERQARVCAQCKGHGKIDGFQGSADCSGCRGSGWANAYPTSPYRLP